jgi:hypothetical protein
VAFFVLFFFADVFFITLVSTQTSKGLHVAGLGYDLRSEGPWRLSRC